MLFPKSSGTYYFHCLHCSCTLVITNVAIMLGFLLVAPTLIWQHYRYEYITLTVVVTPKFIVIVPQMVVVTSGRSKFDYGCTPDGGCYQC